MIFDTDILVWIQKKNSRAIDLFEKELERKISIYTYMELLQGAQSKEQLFYIKDFLKMFDIEILPLTENIGHRAAIYIEEYTLSSGLYGGDALIAATAIEHQLVLCSSNKKHFKCITDLQFKHFVP